MRARAQIVVVFFGCGLVGCGEDGGGAGDVDEADSSVALDAAPDSGATEVDGAVDATGDLDGDSTGDADATSAVDATGDVDATSAPDTAPEEDAVAPWVAQFGAAGDDEALGVVATGDGGGYVCGYQDGILGVSNIQPDGNSKGVVRRFDRHGAVVDTFEFQSGGTDVVAALTVDGDGAAWVVGRTSGDLFAANAGLFDLFIARLGAGGGASGAQFGDDRPQHPLRLTDLAGEGLAVVGWDDELVQHQQLMDSENGFVARYENGPDGIREAARTRAQLVFNPDRIEGLAFAQDAIVVSGFRFFEDAEGAGGCYVERQPLGADDGSGWRTYLAPAGCEPVAIEVAAGKVYVAGTGVFPFPQAMTDLGEADGFVAALSLEGEVLWIKRYGTASFDEIRDLEFAADGVLLAAGSTAGTLPEAQAQGGSDAMVLAIDGDGVLLGAWQGGSSDDDVVHAIALRPDGNVLIAGGTAGRMLPEQASGGRVDAFVRLLPRASIVASDTP
ncbi:MAG: hypothetical protein U1F43_26040 [Myxococcota bacterium]